jgi:DNA invertase Pin-like site-specific DNA recombinase
MMDGIAIMQRVHARGAAIRVLDKPHLDLTTAIGKGFLVFLSALAEGERERIHKRASEGRQAARKAGRRFGRKPKLKARGAASRAPRDGVAGRGGRDERAPQHDRAIAVTLVGR